MESNLKCFFLRGKYRVSDDFLVLILLIFGGLRYFFYYLCRKMQKWAVFVSSRGYTIFAK